MHKHMLKGVTANIGGLEWGYWNDDWNAKV